ncbi:MAG TPA: Glu-tRNA(Gln) amidotransferase subunit GatE [Thermoplasmata archaeon]|nr:Glu-tRNA(Gln) amidotransferase subunit GatE [Thermoplasmata archaeon]
MRAGLEVHQQLATGKLHCLCPAELSEEVTASVVRKLHATEGEEGQVDQAAQFEAARGRTFRYEVVPSSCLVELDEEPPKGLNAAALDVALTVALLLRARILDEVEVMRKIVVDGSNTTGFQRTALVAVDGSIEVAGRTYSIPSIALEEDAARKVEANGREVGFRLDRLGIPLVEVATGPDITTGADARAVAEEIGAVLRATRRVRRGIGTIREDLNVSTEGGARVEIKGVQELRLLRQYAETEDARQRALLEIAKEVARRGAASIDPTPQDVTPLFDTVREGPLAPTAERPRVVLGIRLPGFAGLLRGEAAHGIRLGRELADHARSVGVKGLVHSDELPGFGVDAVRFEEVRRALHAEEFDAFVLIAHAERRRAAEAIGRVAARAEAARGGVPPETRDPLPDGTTRYSRPLPGRDRMYPETDVPPILVSTERLARLSAELPELPADSRRRLVERSGVGAEVAGQLVRSGELERFDALVGRGRNARTVARLLIQELPSAVPDPSAAEGLRPEMLDELLAGVEAGSIAKEAVPPVLVALAGGAPSLAQAVASAGITGLTPEELGAIVERVARTNLDLIRRRGDGAFSALMGDVMKEVRGRRDGKEVAEAVRRALASASVGGQEGS